MLFCLLLASIYTTEVCLMGLLIAISILERHYVQVLLVYDLGIHFLHLEQPLPYAYAMIEESYKCWVPLESASWFPT
jgi:hypothetical protein